MVRKTALGIVAFILVVLPGAGWYFTSQIIHPAKGPCDKKHFIYCGTPEELGLKYEDISFTASDGVPLKGWYIPGTRKEAVIMVHGHGADRHEGLRWVRGLHRYGMSVLLFDLRNHGTSGGDVTTMGFLEKRDVSGAATWLKAIKNIEQIGVFGVSMGASSGILAMAEDKNIKAGVFEAGFSSLRKELNDIARRDYGLPSVPLINIVSLFFKLRTGISLDAVAPAKAIAKISPRSLLVIHCPGDDYIHFSHGKRIFESAGQPKDFWASPCTTHAEAWQGDPDEGEQRVALFFSKNLR